jgi:uncharacterized protein (TIGR00730 family)
VPLAITVFGSSRIGPDTEEYAAARRLGQSLAEHGFDVVSGGYSGAMEGVSRGAKERGGRVIGVTVEVVARAFERVPNEFLDQEVQTAALLERIDKLVELGAGYVVLPGGAGTLAELGIVWNLALFGALHDKPLIVVGAGWERVLRSMVEHLHTVEADLRFLQLVPSVESAVEALTARLRPPRTDALRAPGSG